MEKVSTRCPSPTACLIAAAMMELSIPPERKHPSGTSETNCRRTDCTSRCRVREMIFSGDRLFWAAGGRLAWKYWPVSTFPPGSTLIHDEGGSLPIDL